MNNSHGRRIAWDLRFRLRNLVRKMRRNEHLRVLGSTENGGSEPIEAVYVINLDRQQVRWKSFADEARRQRADGRRSLLDYCRRVSAIDGKVLESDNVASLVAASYPIDAQYFVDPDPRLLPMLKEGGSNIAMTREEIAVALSHIRVWRQIVADNTSYGLVLEDDVFFESAFASILNQAWRELPKNGSNGTAFDILYLSYQVVERGAHRLAFSQNLVRPIRGYWWLSGYVLSNLAAQKLLQMLPVVGPVDVWMNHLFSELEVYSTTQSIVNQRPDLKSDNQYSITPVLSQAGVPSDSTLIELAQTKGRSPVFGLGFDQIEANLLESALGLLGYRCCNDRWGTLSDNIGQLISRNAPLLFDAYIGIDTITRAFRQLDEGYPDAAFLVPARITQSSAGQHADIDAYFAGTDGKVLALEVRGREDWQPLCHFLTCAVPMVPFPRNADLRDIPTLASKTCERVPIADASIIPLEHDVHPWIVPYGRLSAFGHDLERVRYGLRAGTFQAVIEDGFHLLDDARWTVLEESFPSNRAMFRRENFALLDSGGFRLVLEKKRAGDREYAAGALASSHPLQFGRFEIEMKATKAEGVVSAFFLHRNNPWQELDVEFLGKDTTRLLTNVYFNPGDPGMKLNHGNRGTPIMINLGFDAADDFHRYAIEWEPHEIRWFVDNKLVHVRSAWEPTPIPNLPMRLYCSLWAPRSEDLAGEVRNADVPVCTDVRRITICVWCKAFVVQAQRVGSRS